MRDEPSQAIIVSTPSTPATKIAKARRRQDWEADNIPVVPNMIVPEPNEYIVGTPAEQVHVV